MKAQLLLTRHPIICRKCMHGHQVEVIMDRINSPVEYHCGYCGNYAIVGVPARWPFMEITKAEKQPDIGISASVKPHNTGSSPMQVGEALLKPEKEEKIMPGHAKCKKGCGRSGQCRGYCYSCFHEEYGITYEAYRKHVLFRGEDPREVARRIRKADLQQSDERVQKAKEEFEKAMEEEREIETAPQTDQPVPLFQIFLDPELLDALTKKAKAEYRTPELHAAYLIDKGVRGGQ